MKRWPRPDFLAAAPRPSMWAWAIALSGLIALPLALRDAWSAHAEVEIQAAALAAPVQRPRPRTTTDGEAQRASSTAENEARVAARRLADALAYPWDAALASLEAATPGGVQWMSFDHSLDNGEVRLEGQAADAAAAVRLTDALAVRPGWRDAALVRLQRTQERDAGAPTAMRFAVESHLDAAALAADVEPGGP